MTKCDNCGRDDGHWIGCETSGADGPMDPAAILGVDAEGDHCTFEGCSEPRRSADKRVKFCETHSDPKNRK
jgi:hypothetical protein